MELYKLAHPIHPSDVDIFKCYRRASDPKRFPLSTFVFSYPKYIIFVIKWDFRLPNIDNFDCSS